MSLTKCAAKWQDHIVACDASGLLQKVYCAKNGLSLKQFWNWKSRLRKQNLISDAKQASTRSPLMQVVVTDDTAVPIATKPATNERSGITLWIDGRFRIELDRRFNAATLSQLLTALAHA